MVDEAVHAGDAHWRRRAGVTAVKGVLDTDGGLRATADAPVDAPVRLDRYAPSAAVEPFVRHYWVPRWHLPPGAVVEQRALDYPSSNLVIEPDRVALHGPARGSTVERLEGSGWAFGVLLQPGTARALVGDAVRRAVGASVAVDGLPGFDDVVAGVRAAIADGDDATAVETVDAWFAGAAIELGADGVAVRDVLDLVERDRSILRVDDLSATTGRTVRALQRLVRDQLGLTPKQLIQRHRMQEAAWELARPDHRPLAELATDLGFADQAHFSRDFRDVVGESPARYAAHAAAAPGNRR
ncbi:helix-turn-helix domain-containing protein [Agromyces sp. MMS24-JH15]|uniref:helix-turn-helix domain-containing protein n=1 Tax=Agromyces sp. MMS24-JH15 TaxID=3243765 RepID=UPI0037490345